MTNNSIVEGAFPLVAVDGGAATGKSSTSRLLARGRGFAHVDTGSHYRAIARELLARKVNPESGPELVATLADLQLEVQFCGDVTTLCVDGAPVADASLRTPRIDGIVSQVAALPEVRQRVKEFQQGLATVARAAGYSGLVMEGRDIGTVILPHALLKVFLVADEAARIGRRAHEGRTDAVLERDQRDSSRATAPLRPARDAVCIDNSMLTLEETVAKIDALLEERL
jgi:cytidylate kinase